MKYPVLYDSNNNKLAVLDNILNDTASINRKINGEFTFQFEAFEKELKSDFIYIDKYVTIEDDAFDIKRIENSHYDNEVLYRIECEHVFYRLLKDEVTFYTYQGTPAEILADILIGTDFSVGTIDYTDPFIFSVPEPTTKMGLVYILINHLGGEIDFSDNGFTIDIVNTIGQNNGYEARFGKNLKAITKIVDNTDGLETYYTVDVLELKNSNEYKQKELGSLEVIGVGDTIKIIDKVLNLDVENRIISKTWNPIYEKNTTLEIANAIELITDTITKIQTSTVHKGRLYNGIKISTEDGFQAIRSDNKAITTMNATNGFSIATDKNDGNGLQNRFYVDENGVINADLVMGSGSVIKWENINDVPTDIVYQEALSDYITSGTLSSALSNYVTDSALTTTLGEDYVITGRILANYIVGGTISGVTINVDTDLSVGNNVYLGDQNSSETKYVRFNGGATIQGYKSGVYPTIKISAQNVAILDGNVELGSGISYVTCEGTWDFTNANINGIQAFAKFA